MNFGIITQTNSKGQLVIPKAYRDQLGITPSSPLQINLKSDGIYIKPVQNLGTGGQTSKEMYLEILRKTAGAWAGDDWPETEKRMAKIERKASRERRKPW